MWSSWAARARRLRLYVRDHKEPSGAYSQFRLLVSGGWFAVEQSKDDCRWHDGLGGIRRDREGWP